MKQELYHEYIARQYKEEKNMVSNAALESPINNLQQLMAITAEECGELTQVCMKIMRKYDTIEGIESDKLKEYLIEEAGDVMCMLELMIEHGVVTTKQIKDRVKVKREKLEVWSTLVE